MTFFVFPKTFFALGLELELGLGLTLELGLGLRLRFGLELTELRLNTFLIKCPFGQVY